ncbi:MAG: hypothetical protein P8M22_09735 [Phycisphaerales bacterium]|nr:hypothetical protein [Phycisphaerales bacterium]
MSEGKTTRLLSRSGLLVLLAIAMPMSCSSPPQITRQAGPDAQVSRLPESAQEDRWPSEKLEFAIARPSYDQGTGKRPSVDSRTTLAVLDPDRATWIMASRLDDAQGLELTNQLEQLVIMSTLHGVQPGASHPLQAALSLQPEGKETMRTLPGGQWRILKVNTATDGDHSSSIVLAIQDEQGKVAGEAEIDLPTARDLLIRLSSAIRSPGP